VAKKDKPIVVGWNNMLPEKHLLTVDETLHWAFMRDGVSIENGGVPVVTHLHRGHTESSRSRLTAHRQFVETVKVVEVVETIQFV